MAKLLGIISLILAIVLFPPAALAVISNNAVPGDSTYPIKRFLEDGIYAVASLTPTTKAWFAAARSDRRFQEVAALITQGKQAGDTLNELVEQTQIAASQINQITDQKQKEQLINQLSQSIEKYDEKLKELSSAKVTPTPTLTPTTMPSAEATPVPAKIAKPKPTSFPAATPLPKSTVQPTPATSPQPVVPPDQQDDVEEARKKLEEIKKRLAEDKKKVQKQKFEKDKIDRKHQKEDQDKDREDREKRDGNDDKKMNVRDGDDKEKNKKSDN